MALDREALQAGPSAGAGGAKPQAREDGGPGRDDEVALAQAYAQRDFFRFEALARTIAERFPEHGLGWKALGVAALHLGRREEAIAPLRNAARLLPGDAETQGNLGNVLLEVGLLGEAEATLRRAVVLQPRDAQAHVRLGRALCALHRYPEAEAEFSDAVALRPDSADARCGLGQVMFSRGRLAQAEAAYRQALSLKPDHREAYAGIGALLVGGQRLAEAEAHCRAALTRDPARVDAHDDLGTILLKQGRLAEAEASYRRALAVQPDHLESRSCLLFLLHYAATLPPEVLLEESRAFGALASGRASRPFTAWTCDPGADRLRVGLVSGDLRQHPVGYFLESVLAHSDPRRIEWVAYPTYADTDEVSGRLRKHLSGWHSLAGLSDEGAARRIHEDGIHVLIDLSGHTVHNRLPVFAWRPAPVQVTWLGYFATTGLAEMDYLLADKVTLPPGLQSRFTETIRYLPDTRLCFTPPDTAEEPAPAPALANDFATFGCFQALPKITDDVLHAWGRILASCPRSRLRLQNESLSDAGVVASLKVRLAAQGIDSGRVDMHGFAPRSQYLAAHAQVDFLLDTFPYPGGTTTCEALWMGVPTLTLAGESMIARQGASLLTAAGLADWVATSRDDYVSRAIALSGNLPHLAALRQGLRDQVRGSALFDAPRFARNLEDALQALWAARARR
ncbi:MAG: tetratricopeptide repeat protein [Betaproteobacteria bacterium]|nr:tetratricopeptide repeat protein [Betaproteobacteria bacterium]